MKVTARCHSVDTEADTGHLWILAPFSVSGYLSANQYQHILVASPTHHIPHSQRHTSDVT